jgi:hypothetical protein
VVLPPVGAGEPGTGALDAEDGNGTVAVGVGATVFDGLAPAAVPEPLGWAQPPNAATAAAATNASLATSRFLIPTLTFADPCGFRKWSRARGKEPRARNTFSLR